MKESLIILIILALFTTSFSEDKITGTCLRFSVDGQSCLECKSHYHLFEGTCYVDIHGCQNYVFGNICRRCQAGYILVNNECCDKHCMAQIFKNYQHEIVTAQTTEEQEMQKISLEGYEKAATTVSKMLFKNSQAFEIVSTRNQKLSKVIRYFMDVNTGGRMYKAILDYKFSSGVIELIEYLDVSSFSKVTQKVLMQGDLESNKKAVEGLKFVNTEFGTKVYGFILSRLSSTSYTYGNQMKFIYTGQKKVIMIEIVVNNQMKPYTIWYEEKTNVQEIKALLEEIKKDEQYEKETAFIAIHQYIANQAQVAFSNIKIKNVTKIAESQYSFTYINVVTNEKFEYHGQWNFQTKTVVVIKNQVVVKKTVQQIGLPILPSVLILKKEEVVENQIVQRCSGYLETVKSSFNILAIQTAKIQKFETNVKISIISIVEGKKIRSVILIDNTSNQITLIDESLVEVTEKNKIFIEKLNEDNTVTITTNSIEELEKTDSQVRYVFEHLTKVESNKVYGEIVTVQVTEGSISNEYTFITKLEHKAEKQITVSYNKQTKITKVIDYKEIPQKDILIRPLPLPVMNLTKEEINTKEIRQVCGFISESNIELLGQIDVTSVTSVQEIKTELGIKYKMTVVNSHGKNVSVTVSKIDSEEKLLIEDVRLTKQVEIIKKAVSEVSSQISVNVVTGVKTEWQISSSSNLTSQLIYTPQIISTQECEPVGIQNREYVACYEQIVKSKCKNNTGIQTISIVDKTTKKTTVLSEVMVQIEVISQPPMISEIIISRQNFQSQIKIHNELKVVVSTVTKQNSVLIGVIPVSTVVQNFTSHAKVTLIYEIQGKTERVVSIVNTQTMEVKIIEDIKIGIIKPITVIKNTTADGKTTIISNSIEQIRKTTVQIDSVIETIRIKNPEIIIEEIESIMAVDLLMTSEITVVAGTSTGIVEQISVSVVKSTNEVRYTNVQVIEIEDTLIHPVPIPCFPIQPSDPQIISILPIIQEEQSSLIGTGIVVIEANTQTNIVGSSVSIKIRNSVNQEFLVKVQHDVSTGLNIITDIRAIGGTVQVVQNLVHQGKVEVSVSAVTGIKTEFTSSVNATSLISSNVISVIKNGCTPVGIQRRYFNALEQDIVQSECHDGSAIQTIVNINSSTHQVSVINEQSINIVEVRNAPVIHQQIITSVQFQSSIKVNVELSSAISVIVKTNPVLIGITPVSTVIENFQNFSMQTMIFNVQGHQERVVTIVNKVDHKVTIVEDIKLVSQIKGVSIITETKEDGKVVVISNSVQQITKINKNVTIAITAIETQFSEIVTTSIKTIESIELSLTSEIKVIAETKTGITQQISVSIVKQTGEVRITDVQIISQEEIIIMPRPLPIIEIKPTDPQVISCLPIITQQQGSIIGTEITVISAISQTNSFGSVITMNVTNSQSQTYTVTVQKEFSTGVSTIIDVRQVGVYEQTVTVAVQQSSSSVSVNMVTGIKTEFIVSSNVTSHLTFIPTVVVNQECIPMAVQQQNYVACGCVEQTIQSRCNNGTGVSTTVLINSTSNTHTIIDQHLISVVEIGIVPVVQQTVITQAQFSTELSVNVNLQTTINKVVEVNVALTGITPITTIIDTYQNTIKTTLVYKVEEKTETVVTITNIQTQEVTIVEDIKIDEIKQVTVMTNLTSEGKTVVISNSVEEIKKVNIHIENAITTISQKFTEVTLQSIESIQSTNLSLTSEVTIVYEVSTGVSQQVTVSINSQTGVTTIIDAQILPPVLIHPIRPPCVIIPPTEYVTPEIMTVVSTIQLEEVKILGESSHVVEIKSETHHNAIIYTAIMQSESKTNFTVKVEKDIKTGLIQINDIREVKTTIQTEIAVETKSSITVSKIDKHTGVVIVQTNDIKLIKSSQQTTSVLNFIQKTESQIGIQHCRIKAIETRDYDTQLEETALYACDNSHGIQVTVMIEKATQNMEVIGHLETTLDMTSEVSILPVIHENTITKVSYSSFIKTDIALKTTVQSVISSNIELKGIIPEVTFIEDLHKVKKFTFVFHVSEKVERIVAIYESATSIKVIEKIEIPADIKPIITIVKTDQLGVITNITNSLTEVRKVDVHIDQVIEKIRHTYSFVSDTNIEGIQTCQMTGATQYTILAKNEYNKEQQITVSYKHQTEELVIIDDQVIPRITDQFIVPLPAPIVELNATELTSKTVTEMVNFLIKQTPSPFKIGTTVIAATKIEILTGYRYELTVNSSTGVEYIVSIEQNTESNKLVIIDIAKPLETLPVFTEVIVDQLTGITKTVTSSQVAIEKNSEYTKIRDFLFTKHTQLKSNWVLESSVQINYMRSTEQTYIFRKGDQIIQSTVLVDKRNKEIIELDYKTLTEKIVPGVVELPKKHAEIHIVQSEFTHVAETNTVIKTCIEFAEKTDFTLKGKIPAETILEDFQLVKKITFVFKSETKTDRIVMVFDVQTKKAKVIDLGVVSKNITASTTITKNDVKGNVVVTTSNIAEVTKINSNFNTVVRNITSTYEYLSTYTIKTVQVVFRKVTEQKITIGTTSFGTQIYQSSNITAGVQIGELFEGQITFSDATGDIIQIGFNTGAQVGGKISITTIQEKSIQHEIVSIKQIEYMQTVITSEQLSTSVVAAQISTAIQIESSTQIGTSFTINQIIEKEHPMNHIFECNITNSAGVNMIVTVDQNINTGVFVIIDIHSTQAVEIVIAPIREIITEINVDIKTGVKTTITNNVTQITTSEIRSHAIKTIVESRTELSTYQIESIVQREYETHIEETVLFISSSNTTAQVTVNINKTTNVVSEIGFVKPLINLNQTCILPVINQETLSHTQFEYALTTNSNLQSSLQVIHQTHTSLVGINPTTTIIQEMESSIKTTFVFEVQGKFERIITIQNQQSTTATIIEDAFIVSTIKPVTSIVKVDVQTGLTVKISNDISIVQQYQSNIQQIINDIKIKVPSFTTEQIEYIQTTELSRTSEIIIISESSGVTVQVEVSVNSQGQINIIDVIETPIKPIGCIKPIVPQIISILPVDYEKPEIVTCINTAIQQSGYVFSSNPQIISIVKKAYSIYNLFIVEIKTETGMNVNITVQIDKSGQNAVIIDSRASTAVQTITQTTTGVQTQVSIQVQVNSVTGLKTNFTVSETVINELHWKAEYVVSGKCKPVALESTLCGISVEETTQYLCKNGTAIQTTAIVNINTNQVIVIDQHQISVSLVGVAPVVSQVLITQHNFQTAIQTNVELKQTIQVVTQTNTALIGINPVNTVIQQHQNGSLITLMYEIKGVTERVVTLYNSLTHTVKIIQDIKITQKIESVTIITNTSSTGVTTTTSNSIQAISQINTQVNTAVTTVTTQFSEIKVENIQSVSVTTLTGASEFVFIAETTTGVTEQISVTVIKETGVSIVTNVEIIGQVEVTIQPVPLPIIQVNINSEVVTQITTAIVQTSQISVGQNIQVISVSQQNSTIGSSFVVTIKNERHQQYVVTVQQNATTGSLVVVDSRVTKVITNQSQTITESTTEINVNVVTGIKKEWVVSANVSAEIIVKPDVLITQDCTAVGVQTREYIGCWEQTVMSKCRNNTGVQTTVIVDKQTKVTTLIDQHQISISQVLVAPVIPEIIIPKHNFEVTIKKDVSLQVVVDFVKVQRPALISIIPTSTVIEVHQQTKKVTMIFEISKKKERIVSIYNANLETSVQIIEDVLIEGQITGVSVISTTNQIGQTVVVSNSIEQIRKVTQKVDTVIQTVTQTYQEIQIKNIQSIQTTQLTGSTQFTFIAESTTGVTQQISASVITATGAVIITNAQIVPVNATVIRPVPLPVISVETTSTIVSQISTVIETSVQVTKVFGTTSFSIVNVTSQTSEIGSTFQLTVTTESQSQYTVTVVQQFETGAIVVIDVRPSVEIQVVEIKVAQHSIQIEIDATTGVTSNWTVSSTVSQQLVYTPTLPANCIVGGVQIAQYGGSTQQNSIARCANGTGIQTTVIVNNQNQVLIIDQHQVDVSIGIVKPPVLPEVIITQSNFESTIKTNVNLQIIVQTVHTSNPNLVTIKPVNTIIQEIGTSIKCTMIYEINGTTERVVTVYNTTGKGKPIVIEDIKITLEDKPITFINRTTETGAQVIITNNVHTAIKVDAKVELVIDEVKIKYPSISIESIQTVESTQFSATVEYNFVSKNVNGLMEQVQVTLVKATNEIRITNVQTIDINMEYGVVVEPAITPCVEVLPEEYNNFEYKNVVDFIQNTQTSVKNSKVVSITTQQSSLNTHLEVKLETKSGQVIKVGVNKDKQTLLPEICNIAPVIPNFVRPPPVVIEETCDPVTAVKTTVYNSNTTFQRDEYYSTVTNFIQTNVQMVAGFQIHSAVKEVFGVNHEYHVLYKSNNKNPEQITIVVNTLNNQISLLEEKKLVETEIEVDILTPVTPQPIEVTLSNLEKENIKILAQIGNIPEIPGYSEVKDLVTLEKDQIFINAANRVKSQYALLLKDAIIVKVMEKHTLNTENKKLFYKVNDLIYEADVQINGVTKAVKIVDFSKVGSSDEGSSMNINIDLAYGYEEIKDFKSEKNIEFLLNYIREKYTSVLEGAVVKSAEKLLLANGRVNYKIYFKSELQTIKFIVYYEPVFKRVLEVRSYPFETGKGFMQIALSNLVSDPYFKKVDSAIKDKHRADVSDCEVLKVENKDVGSKIIFRTVYSCKDMTYHSRAYILKESNLVEEQAWNEIIEVPTVSQATSVENSIIYRPTKLDPMTISQNIYVSTTKDYVLKKYATELKGAALKHVSVLTNAFTVDTGFIFVNSANGEEFEIKASYAPLTESIQIVNPLKKVNILEGYSAIGNQEKFLHSLDWLKEKNSELAHAVVVESGEKTLMFGNAYRVVFKTSVKYYEYIVGLEDNTERILYQRDYTEFSRNTLKTSFSESTSFISRVGPTFPTPKKIVKLPVVDHMTLPDEHMTIMPVQEDVLPVLISGTEEPTNQVNGPVSLTPLSTSIPVTVANSACLRVGSDGKCLECDYGYALKNGDCIKGTSTNI